MKVVIKHPEEKPFAANIDNDLSTLQELVDGYIECVYLNENVCMIYNEEGKLKNLPINFAMNNDIIIVGTAIFVGINGEEFDDIDWVMEQILVDNFEKLFPVF